MSYRANRPNGYRQKRTSTSTSLSGTLRRAGLCVVGGFDAETLTTTAVSHDPQHVPYGICWLESAEAKDESAIEQRAASSSGWGPSNITVHEPLGKTRWKRGEAIGSARFSIAGDTNTASSSGYATKQPLQAPPV